MGQVLRIALILVVAALAAAVLWREFNSAPEATRHTQSLRGIGPDPDPIDFIAGDDVRTDRDIMDEFDLDRRRRRLLDERPLTQRRVAEEDAAYRRQQTTETGDALVRSLGYLGYAQQRVRDHRAALATMKRMTELCARHRHEAQIYDQCENYNFFEHRGDSHLAVGDAVAARADYARTEEMMRRAKAASDGSSVGVYDPDWKFWIKFTVAAAKAGDAAEAVRVATNAVNHVRSMAAQNPSAGTLQRRYAWSLNWRGDAHLQARDAATAVRDYTAALDVLRKYDAPLGTFDDLADQVLNGPREFQEYAAKVKANPAVAKSLERPNHDLSLRAPRRYVGKTKVQRDIGWTLRRLAQVRPTQVLETEITAIDVEVRRRDPGPPSSDEYPLYMFFLAGDARRGANDLAGAVKEYDAGLNMLGELYSPESSYDQQREDANRRTQAQIIARKGLVLIELRRRDEARRLLDDAIAHFREMQAATPWATDLATDIAWANEVRDARQ